MKSEELEILIEKKIKPIIEDAMHKYLGITVNELESDISNKIKNTSLFDYPVDVKVPFKKAKRLFKKYYVTRLLETNPSTITELADQAGLKRESFHRLLKDLDIDLEKFRRMQEYSKETEVAGIIKTSLNQFKPFLNDKKFKVLYEKVPALSKDVTSELPAVNVPLKEAEVKFEKKYLKKALAENKGNISQTAKAIGLRFETLHRKLKAFGII